MRFHFETSKRGRGGRRYLPYAFTEQGVAMLSSVLRSPRAVQVNIAIMRTFVRLREMLLSNAELARKLAALENKYDAQFKVVFDAIRELMLPPVPPKRQIGFHVREGDARGYRVRRRKLHGARNHTHSSSIRHLHCPSRHSAELVFTSPKSRRSLGEGGCLLPFRNPHSAIPCPS